MTQGDCKKCVGLEDEHAHDCIVRKLVFNKPKSFIDRSGALELAIEAMEKNMGTQNLVTKTKFDIGQLESIFIKGDIKAMTEIQRIEYVRELCRSLGLNPMTRPFDYIEFQSGKLQVYANKACTDQLRAIYGISLKIITQVIEEGLMTVVVEARFPDGRSDQDIGCLMVGNLRGDSLANAKMKCVTKAKRRVTLSICGLGMLDETEVETIPGAKAPSFNKQETEVTSEVKPIIKPVAQLQGEAVQTSQESQAHGAFEKYKKPADPCASEEDVKAAFAEAKAAGYNLDALTDYIKSEIGKEKFRSLSVSELLVVRDAIRDKKIGKHKAHIAEESRLDQLLPEEEASWNLENNGEQESFLA